jgi:hypothetical protein
MPGNSREHFALIMPGTGEVMSAKQHGPKDEKLLAEIVAHFVKQAKRQGIPPPWHLQVWDDAGQIFYDVLLKEEGDAVVPSIDNTPPLPLMLHPPFRAELSDATDDDGRTLYQEGIDWMNVTVQ